MSTVCTIAPTKYTTPPVARPETVTSSQAGSVLEGNHSTSTFGSLLTNNTSSGEVCWCLVLVNVIRGQLFKPAENENKYWRPSWSRKVHKKESLKKSSSSLQSTILSSFLICSQLGWYSPTPPICFAILHERGKNWSATVARETWWHFLWQPLHMCRCSWITLPWANCSLSALSFSAKILVYYFCWNGDASLGELRVDGVSHWNVCTGTIRKCDPRHGKKMSFHALHGHLRNNVFFKCQPTTKICESMTSWHFPWETIFHSQKSDLYFISSACTCVCESNDTKTIWEGTAHFRKTLFMEKTCLFFCSQLVQNQPPRRAYFKPESRQADGACCISCKVRWISPPLEQLACTHPIFATACLGIPLEFVFSKSSQKIFCLRNLSLSRTSVWWNPPSCAPPPPWKQFCCRVLLGCRLHVFLSLVFQWLVFWSLPFRWL